MSLFGLSPEQKESHNIQKEWPLGYEDDGDGESFCLDSLCSTEFTLDLSPLRRFAREMEGVGLRVIESMSTSVGFKNPFKEDPTRVCSLLWISKRTTNGKDSMEHVSSSGFYPFVVGLHYQLSSGQKYSLLTDSGRVSVLPDLDSVMVTVGDIAQVNDSSLLFFFNNCVRMDQMLGIYIYIKVIIGLGVCSCLSLE